MNNMIDVTCPNCGCEIHIESAKPNVHDLPKDSDCISRRAAIETLAEYGNGRTVYIGAEEAIRRIEQLPSAQQEQRWIPCSERLPEYGVAVLTYDGHCFCVEKRIPTIKDDEGEPIIGNWWVSDDYDEYDSDYYPNLRDGACIAWMPLPESYEEDLCSGCGYLGESCVGEGCGKLTERKDGESDD